MSYIEIIASKLNDANVAHVVVSSIQAKLNEELAKLPKSKRNLLWHHGVTLDGATTKLENELRRPNKSTLQIVFILSNALEALTWYGDNLNLKKELSSDINYIKVFKDNSDTIKIIGEVHADLSSLSKKLSEMANATLNYLDKGDN